ncbi:MAG: aminotransferase class V-fold PLP-dependent enzyme [Patescibacteria group bacterium]
MNNKKPLRTASIVGDTRTVRLASGKNARITMLNNAATTPPFKTTLKAVNSFSEMYGTFHRGAGPRASATYTEARDAIKTIKEFIGLPKGSEIVFTQNTSNAINLLVRLLQLTKKDIILTSELEHTSNNLPWLYNSHARIVRARAENNGKLNYNDLEQKAKKYKGRIRVVALTGASNMTGYVPDIPRLSRIAHSVNALLCIDAAQLAPHKQISMSQQGIDILAFSAHKIYAPFGLGVLALPRSILDQIPVDAGGGSIDMISTTSVVWAPTSLRHQTGTWNVMGIVAAAASCRTLMDIGWDVIESHEHKLIAHASRRLPEVQGLVTPIPLDMFVKERRVGILVFNLPGYHHALLSAILEHEYGIETRAGTICNHMLVRRWMNVSNKEQRSIERKISSGNRLASYGIVRASIGIHNTKKDIDILVEALKEIQKNGPKYTYRPVPKEEIYLPIHNVKI